MECGPSQDLTPIPFFRSSGEQKYTTGYETRAKAYQDQIHKKEWYPQLQQEPWVSKHHPWYYNQPERNFWLNRQPSCSQTLIGCSHPLSHQQEPHGCPQSASQQQELHHYPPLFQQRQLRQILPESRLNSQMTQINSQTMEDANNSILGGAEATTSRRNAQSAPANGDQPKQEYTGPPNVSWKPNQKTGGPSFEKPWELKGYNQEE